MKVAIIGGGLAGTACAYMLKQSGMESVIYEAADSLASGASGNPIGLYNPRFSAHRSPESDFYVAGFAAVSHTFGRLKDIDWDPCGTLHLINDEKKARRFPQTVKNWRWDPDHMKILNVSQASDVAGVEIYHDALYLPDSGFVSPAKLCRAYAEGIEVKLNTKIEGVRDMDADVVIIASAMGATAFPETKDLPLTTVRGQVTRIRQTKATEGLKCNLCFGGYLSKALDGVHTLGATFQRWLDHDEVIDEDNYDNIKKLAENLPELAEGIEIVGERAAVRTSTIDHFPIVGRVPGHENLYISTGHGSHGIIGSLVSATLIADMIFDRPRTLPLDVQQALSAERFL